MKKFKNVLCLILICCFFISTFSIFADESVIEESSIDTSNFEQVSDLEDEFLYFSNERNINLSSNAKGCVIDIEKDILNNQEESDEEAIKKSCDNIINKIIEFDFNTIYIKTIDSNKKSFFNIQGQGKSNLVNFEQIDLIEYLINKAKENNIYITMVVDLLTFFHEDISKNPDYINNTIIDICAKNISMITSKYKPDGILLDNYYNVTNSFSFINYSQNGGGIGFENFMKEISISFISSVSYAIKSIDYSIAIGLLCDNVWSNDPQSGGSNTNSNFTLKDNANLPINDIIKGGYIDFITIKSNYSISDSNVPYGETAKWWSDTVKDSSVMLYMLHYNEKLNEENGFNSPDEIIKQIIKSKEQENYSGSVFNSFSALIENYQKTTELLLKYLKENGEKDLILKDLYMTRPSKLSFVTYENTVSFTGTSDPNFELLVNEKAQEVSQDTGNFQITYDLKIGENIFIFKHKSTTITYNVTKKIRVLKSISPNSMVVGDGGMKIAISATAYNGANVWAKIAGTTVKLSMRQETLESERESIYRDYYGYYTLPEGKSQDNYLGNVVVFASFEGNNEQMQGGLIKVNKKENDYIGDVSIGSGDIYEPNSSDDIISGEIPDFKPVSPVASKLVKITTNSAETFPTTILDDDSVPTNYPYPKGSYDYTNGDVLSYSWNGKTYTYYNLKSNRRLYIKDLEVVNNNELLNSVVNNYATSISVENNGKTTDISFNLKYKTPPIINLTGLSFTENYTIKNFNPEYMVVDMPYVNATNGINFKENPLFSNASISQITEKGVVKTRISFKFKNGKSFSGASSYFDSNGKLIISVRNPMKSLSGVRVVLSQGHGGSDTGANGFNGINEVDLNRSMTEKVSKYLKDEGGEVIVISPNVGDSTAGLIQKMEEARAKKPDIFLCLHHNSTISNSNATGVETYYFAPFTQPMAQAINNELASYYKNTMYGDGSNKYNRGDNFSWRYMTREMTFPAVLIEYGFISNPKEFDKLTQSKNQDGLAKATVEGIKKYLNGM